MAVRYLLDTNTASYIIKNKPPRVMQRLLLVPMEQIAVSTITEAELRFGVARREDSLGLALIVNEFLKRVAVLPWDSEAARAYAGLRATLERDGRPIGNMDLMIAAHALALKTILVTSDRTLHRLKQLQIEDWT